MRSKYFSFISALGLLAYVSYADSIVSIEKIGDIFPRDSEVYISLNPIEGDAIKIRLGDQKNIEQVIPDGTYFPEVNFYQVGGKKLLNMKACLDTYNEFFVNNEFEVQNQILSLKVIPRADSSRTCEGKVKQR